MSELPRPAPASRLDAEPGDRGMASTYLAVVAIEVGVLIALWAVGRYFGG